MQNKQNKKNEKKNALTAATIRFISREGLERLTTKSVEAESGISERYIFLYFSSKDGLLQQTFDQVEKEMAANLCSCIRTAKETCTDNESLLRQAWAGHWKYIISRPNHTRFYIRYFYSEQFERFSREDHSKNTGAVKDLLLPLFKDGDQAEDLLRYAFTTMLSSALAAITGTGSSPAELCERIFRMIFQSMKDQLVQTGKD